MAGVGTGGVVQQDRAPLQAQAFLMEKMKSDYEAAVGGQALVGEAEALTGRSLSGIRLCRFLP